ncbi:MAG: hypothetical protein JWO36_3813 [Myxococcales bacterium]|nr:hypothetical protein [Myxococcales bacterium]
MTPMITTPEDQAVCPTCGQAYPSRAAHCLNDGTQLILRRGRGPDASGRVLDGRYDVRNPIGEGVLGVVYVGWQRILDREVAIKLLRPGFTVDGKGLERFSEAARLACQLVAPAITATYDCSNDNGLIYIVMELVRGRSLADLLAEGPLPAHRAIPIAIQICDALAAAAKLRLLHGDLKPTNVMLVDFARDNAIKVSDFGLVRAFLPDVTAGAEPRSLSYVAPELASDGVVNVRTDLYALGCMLYELLAGRPPFIDNSIRGLVEKHQRELPARLPREVPARLGTIISTLLAKKPADRFDSAAAVGQALHAVQGTSGRSGPIFVGDANAAAGARSGAHTRPPITGSQQRPSTGAHSVSGVPRAITGGSSGPHATTPPSGGHSLSGPHATTPPSGQHPSTNPHPISSAYPNSAIDPNLPRPAVAAPQPTAGSMRLIVIVMSALIAIGIGIGVAAYLMGT